MTTLRQAAQAVVDRWDAPAWSDLPTTGKHIAALRKALEATEQEPDLYRSYIVVCEELVKRTVECDALMAESARYQFMKSRSRVAGLDIDGDHSWTCQIFSNDVSGPTLDAAIDAALKQAGEK